MLESPWISFHRSLKVLKFTKSNCAKYQQLCYTGVLPKTRFANNGYVLFLSGVNRITYWSQGVASLPHKYQPPLSSARQHPSHGDWRLRGNIIRTALCWVVWHNVHSQQHTHVSSSYRSSRLGLSHWDPYAVCRGGCLELYYCNMVEWSWWDSNLIWKTNWFPSVLWHCWFGHMTCKIISDVTYDVFGGTLNLAQSVLF